MSVATSNGVAVKNMDRSGVGVTYSPHRPLEQPVAKMAIKQKTMEFRKEGIFKSLELYLQDEHGLALCSPYY
jgi:hypothetical protein